MFVFREQIEGEEGKWEDFEIWGITVRLKIRPYVEAFDEKVAKKHTRTKKNHFGMEVSISKSEQIQAEKDDYYLEDFEGVGDKDGAWPVSIETKQKLLDLKVPFGDQTVRSFVYEKSKEFTFGQEKKEGNSDSSPEGSVQASA